jgi:guanylate kinase
VLLYELFVRANAVFADAHNFGAAKLGYGVAFVTKTAGFCGTPWRVVFGVKIQHQPFARVVCQGFYGAVLVGERKVRGLLHGTQYTWPSGAALTRLVLSKIGDFWYKQSMNELKQIDAFRTVLKNYQLSQHAKDTLAGTKLVLLVGPTSSGRNTIINRLLETGTYHYVVSDTTRQLRVKDGVPIEKDGREYWFRPETDVLRDLQNGEFLEAAVIHDQQVSGISIREIEKAHQAGQVAITDIEPVGAATIHKLKPEVQIIFVVPPNCTEWLQRFRSRSDLPEDEVRRRLAAARSEILTALANDYYLFAINDDVAEATQAVDDIVRTGDAEPEEQLNAKLVAKQLLADIQEYLEAK